MPAERPFVHKHMLELGTDGDTVIWSSLEDEQRLESIESANDLLLDRCENTALHAHYSLRC